MKKIFLVPVLLALLSIEVTADSSVKPTHQIGLGIGAIHYQVRDDIVAPLRWSGLGPVGDLSYTYAGENGRHGVDLRIPFAFSIKSIRL